MKTFSRSYSFKTDDRALAEFLDSLPSGKRSEWIRTAVSYYFRQGRDISQKLDLILERLGSMEPSKGPPQKPADRGLEDVLLESVDDIIAFGGKGGV